MGRQALKMCLDLTAHVVKHVHMDICAAWGQPCPITLPSSSVKVIHGEGDMGTTVSMTCRSREGCDLGRIPHVLSGTPK